MKPPGRVAVLTTGRQDFGILRSTLLAMLADPRFDPLVWAGGMHLSSRFGRTVDLLRDDGIPVDRELAFVDEPPDPIADAARAVDVIGKTLESDRPECLLVVGDRSETLAAGLAATIVRVPIVHLHGGEESEGAIDNAMRHALTKLSHLHLVSHERYARRVRQMGEDPARVIVVGAPGLDNLHRKDLLDPTALSDTIGLPLHRPLILATVHPTTLADDLLADVRAVTAALDTQAGTVVVTLPNADHGGDRIRAAWEGWARYRPDCALMEALGERVYWSLLREADLVIGNSSSGLIEAPAAGAPVVNVGSRQDGRLRDGRIWDAPSDATAVRAAVADALAAGRAPQTALDGPTAAHRIIDVLARWPVPSPPGKRFHDVTGGPA